MLLSVFASVRRWAAGLPSGTRNTLIIVLTLAGVAVAVAGEFLPLLQGGGPVSVLVGCSVGLAWTLAANVTYWFVLSARWRKSLDWRSQQPVVRRRLIGMAIIVMWFAVLLGLNSAISGQLVVLLGALNVLILLSVARYAVSSDEEREEWSDRKEAELRQRLILEAFEKGLIDENGNPTGLAESSRPRRGSGGLRRGAARETRPPKVDKDEFFSSD